MYQTLPALFKEERLPGVALLAIAVAEFGTDCFDWEPEILRANLSEELNIEITDRQSDKLQAAITVISTDHFENDWHTFNTVIHCLNGEPVDYDTFDPIDAEQIAAALPEINILRSQFVDSDIKFSAEVNMYAGMIFSEYGLLFTPHIFPTATMPNLAGEHYADSQTEKQDALSQIYTAKKEQIEDYLVRTRGCYPD